MDDSAPAGSTPDPDDARLLRSVRRLVDRLSALPPERGDEPTPLGRHLSAVLGADVRTLPVVSEDFAPHRLVDVDIALAELAGDGPGSLLGVSGGRSSQDLGLAELLSAPYSGADVGPVDYATRATGPDTERQVVAFGIRCLTVDGVPVAVLQRMPRPEYGRSRVLLEVLAAEPAVCAVLLARLRALMLRRSVLRGQVLSFAATEYGSEAGATFLPRPHEPADGIVLPAGLLEKVVGHVVGIGEHRDALRAAGQHLKRGILLHGPPGTGKTLTVRHLLSETPGTTAVLLTGPSLHLVGAAAEVARTFQPSIVVLEDVDLVAMDRDLGTGPAPVLFEVLDALDGLDGDADVAFVLTTNRVAVLERALAERPGRVDLAVEMPLPDADARSRLFRRYAGQQSFSAAALDAAASRAEGTTGSFPKELVRRAVLAAAVRGEDATDADLTAALEELLSGREALTRRLLGHAGAGDDPDEVPAGDPAEDPAGGTSVPPGDDLPEHA
ncbi:AAA family ATPase [Kocuria sp. NPDC057446]|uniref:AAA family ATPase n=1 Tax=Kocuria sp. NPDC057446 TaxID=3346137 RepID=UPI0036C9A19F